jgi:hypothetical protein
MGIHADDLTDQCLDFEEDVSAHFSGHLSVEEAQDKGVLDENGAYYSPGYKRAISCKYCGQGPFVWGQTERGWRLFHGDGTVHMCRGRSKPAETPVQRLERMLAAMQECEENLLSQLDSKDQRIADLVDEVGFLRRRLDELEKRQ